MKKPALLVIFLTVFIDLIGFGIVLPLVPVYSREFGAADFQIGFIVASYSAMQFLFAPAWGRLSDRIGRRPVLLISLAGSTISYVLFGVASTLPGAAGLGLLLVSRVFAGICGANLSVASAYIADITSPETRSKRMGLIGMAFGFGFILGPAVGAFSASTLGIAGPGWVAAGFCGANFLLATFILKESKAAHSEHVPSRPRLAQYLHTLHQPQLGLLISIYFLATFCFTCFETTFPLLLLENPHRETLPHVGYLFAYCGLLSALIQGGLIGRLLKVWGEHGLIVGSLLIVAASLALMPYLNSPGGVFLTLGLFATGSGIARPPIFGLISTLAPPNEQGSTLGVAQSAGSLARVVGPVFATAFFAHKPSLPYLLCAAIGLMTCLAAGYRLTRRRSTVAPYEIPSAK